MQNKQIKTDKMESLKKENIGERRTLIQALERLDHKCIQLNELNKLAESLKGKLNRTDGYPQVEDGERLEQVETHKNIVELFNSVAEKMEVQINLIGNNLESSIIMID